MEKKQLTLVCNAHLDPAWLWEWEEGLAETLSTFRTAARFCDEFDTFVFCHNESILYQWVEEHEPGLFRKIQDLVKQGRWHIMGGWVVQPDCNMPSGESFVRQILQGKLYFLDRFGVEPRTAVNFDPFGHTRGLVQILKKSGYNSYLFCRPDAEFLELQSDDFIWVGYDGSEIMAHRASTHYNSELGKARTKVETWMGDNPERQSGLVLWGIGNHGGGPSRRDLTDLQELMSLDSGWEIRHGIPEDYFDALNSSSTAMPRHETDLNPWAVGCYTSMARVKQKHRLLENMYYSTEKMATHAAFQGLMDYPKEAFHEALEDLLFCEFHDILPGSSIREVEDYAIQKLNHGLEIVSRQRASAFFSLLRGERPADDGEHPLFVYNPHPFPVRETIVFEFQPPEPNSNIEVFWLPEMFDHADHPIPCQVEKESSSIANDHRKRVAFKAEMLPGQMNRFSCRIREVAEKPEMAFPSGSPWIFKTDVSEVSINPDTGLMDGYRIAGRDFLEVGAMKLMVMNDDADPWGMRVRSFRNHRADFVLMNAEESARLAGVSGTQISPVRIIEDGPIRTIVEALFKAGCSSACVRYTIPKRGSEIGVQVRVFWNEKDAMLKLSIPTVFKKGQCRGQVAYGVEAFDREGEELTAQKWAGVMSEDGNLALTVVNDGTYGFDFSNGELRLSLLRSAAYAGHPVEGETNIVPQDRFTPRIDQGERVFRFWINVGEASDRWARIDREALTKNEPAMALVCFPSGVGDKVMPNVMLSDDAIQIPVLKMAEADDRLIVRLFNPTSQERQSEVSIPFLERRFSVSLNPFEIKTMAVDPTTKDFFEVDLNKGDTVLMCSDGLTNMLEDEIIEKIVKENDSPEAAADTLVKYANLNGGKDNIAIVIIKV